jgi:hypothetical protein
LDNESVVVRAISADRSLGSSQTCGANARGFRHHSVQVALIESVVAEPEKFRSLKAKPSDQIGESGYRRSGKIAD